MSDLYVRRSLVDLVREYDHPINPNKEPLETLIRAFRGVQEVKPNYDYPPEQDLSFFRIAGLHGEPFEGIGKYDANWWGGYCHHNDVLFPIWHRAYLYHLEKAMRQVKGCEKVTLPYWDELEDVLGGKTRTPIPWVLTKPKFYLDGDWIDNPLYSYELQQDLVEYVTTANQRYSKHKNYETVRYPMSGLVGTREDRSSTRIHNAKYPTDKMQTEKLNKNVYAWLTTGAIIDKTDDPPTTKYPDTNSVLQRYLACLDVPEYTPFSNKKSMEHYLKGPRIAQYVTAIEDPHNAIHLALGGFYQKGVYNADPIQGANGDMGDNETAGFDPIFFFHHAFIDYVFWTWQKKWNFTKPGDLVIDPTFPGAKSVEGSVGFAPGAVLDQDSPLVPFRPDVTIPVVGADPGFLSPRDVTNIETQLGYTYGIGSLDAYLAAKPQPASLTTTADSSTAIKLKASEAVNRAKYPGSFVIRTIATLPSGKRIEVGREAILSRLNLAACANCQTTLDAKAITPITEELEVAMLAGEEKEYTDAGGIEYHAEVIHRYLGDEGDRFQNEPVGDLVDVVVRIPVYDL